MSPTRRAERAGLGLAGSLTIAKEHLQSQKACDQCMCSVCVVQVPQIVTMVPFEHMYCHVLHGYLALCPRQIDLS